ncbi:MAG TPA: hypothetical protein VI282_15150 [Verrucomicrobiae bacterium]
MKNLAVANVAVDAVLAAVIAGLVATAAAVVDLVRKGRVARAVFVRKVSAVRVPAAVKAATGAVAAVFADAMIVAVVFAGGKRNGANFLRFRPSM